MDEAKLYHEVNVRKGYALWAQTYDSEANALIAAEELYVNDILARLTFSKALDVGTGTGRYLSKLAHDNVQIVAIDQSLEMLAIARKIAQDRGLPVHFEVTSLDNPLPFDAQTFDMLTCALVLCHIPDLFRVAQEFGRVLQDDGYVLITDLHPACFVYGWRAEFEHADLRYFMPTMPHTRDDYLEALTQSGLTILEARDISLGELPEGYFSQSFMREHSEKFFCLIVLAQKQKKS